jgi:hypothetical protein
MREVAALMMIVAWMGMEQALHDDAVWRTKPYGT